MLAGLQEYLYTQFTNLQESLYQALIYKDRYLLILQGLENTILIALFATLIGTCIGVFIAMVKYFAKEKKALRPLEWICNIYVTTIRGTPVLVQLIILSTVIFASVRNNFPVAVVGFGINSGAYVAEIIRAGIAAVDRGQEEAGRSLGLSKLSTMRHIIMPQAVKNILPALGNEFIVLLKETSVAGYLAVHDLTKAAEIIKGNTFNATALFIAALIYLIMVIGMTKVLRIFERRLAKSDNR